jgi:hypothetical protein
MYRVIPSGTVGPHPGAMPHGAPDTGEDRPFLADHDVAQEGGGVASGPDRRGGRATRRAVLEW